MSTALTQRLAGEIRQLIFEHLHLAYRNLAYEAKARAGVVTQQRSVSSNRRRNGRRRAGVGVVSGRRHERGMMVGEPRCDGVCS